MWENLAPYLTELTVQDIADIMNKTASLSRVDISGSCTWCGDFVRKRRYETVIDSYDVASVGFSGGENNPFVSVFYVKYDIQLHERTLLF